MTATVQVSDIPAPNSSNSVLPALQSQKRLSLVPSWLLWSVVFWENFVNLHIYAVYTTDFLSAPVIIAALKLVLLLLVASMLFGLAQRHFTLRSAMRKLVTCWFLSTVAWTFYIILYSWQPAGSSPHASRSDELLGFFEEYTQIFPDQKVFLNFTLETTVMLALGIAGTLLLKWFLVTGAKKIAPRMASAAPQKQPLSQCQFDKAFLVAAIAYVVSNGLFAWVIRVGA